MDNAEFKFSIEKKVVDSYESLESIVSGYKTQGKKIVLTTGVYDMLHDGHVKYLEKAKAFGDILIVGVDDDALTKKNKGEDRPFDELQTRLTVLAGLASVDFLMVKGVEEGNRKIFEVVKPDMIVVSASSAHYDADKEEPFVQRMRKTYVESGIAKDMTVLEPMSSNSTSSKIREMKKLGANPLVREIIELVNKHLGTDIKIEES